MAEYKISIHNKKQKNIVVMNVETDSTELEALVTKKEKSSVDAQSFKMFTILTYCPSVMSTFFETQSDYEQKTWMIYFKSLIELLQQIPPGWSYEAKPDLPNLSDVSSPEGRGLFYNKKTGTIVD